MAENRRENESTAEREGIVDQQDAMLESMQSANEAEGDDPMEGEAPTG